MQPKSAQKWPGWTNISLATIASCVQIYWKQTLVVPYNLIPDPPQRNAFALLCKCIALIHLRGRFECRPAFNH